MSEGPFAGLDRRAAWVPVSAELFASSWREPTPEERTRAVRARAEAYELLQTRLAGWRHVVRVGGMRSRVALLHAPEDHAGEAPTCAGCDAGEYAAAPAEWPCRTVQLLIGEE